MRRCMAVWSQHRVSSLRERSDTLRLWLSVLPPHTNAFCVTVCDSVDFGTLGTVLGLKWARRWSYRELRRGRFTKRPVSRLEPFHYAVERVCDCRTLPFVLAAVRRGRGRGARRTGTIFRKISRTPSLLVGVCHVLGGAVLLLRITYASPQPLRGENARGHHGWTNGKIRGQNQDGTVRVGRFYRLACDMRVIRKSGTSRMIGPESIKERSVSFEVDRSDLGDRSVVLCFASRRRCRGESA